MLEVIEAPRDKNCTIHSEQKLFKNHSCVHIIGICDKRQVTNFIKRPMIDCLDVNCCVGLSKVKP